MSKDTYSALDEVTLASILNAQMYLCYLLCRVILLFFGRLRQNCPIHGHAKVSSCVGVMCIMCAVDLQDKWHISQTGRSYVELHT